MDAVKYPKNKSTRKPVTHLVIVGCFTICLISLIVVGADTISKSIQHRRLQPLTNNLVRKIDRFVIQHFTEAAEQLAKNPRMVEVCSHVKSPDNPPLFSILDTSNKVLGAAIVYVMDSGGLVVGSSRFGNNKSLTGRNYSFRPYFIEAMAGKAYQFPAVGVTTQAKGFYFSAPVTDPLNNTVVGVVVIKTKGETIDQFFHDFQGPLDALLLSPDGVVFSATRDQWFFSIALPLEPGKLAHLKKSRQFSEYALSPLAFTLEKDIVRYENRRAIVQKQDIALSGWQVVTLAEAPFPFLIVGLLSCIVLLFASFWITGIFHRRKESRLTREMKKIKYRRDRAVEAQRQTLLELESIFSTSHVGIVLLRSRRVVTINQRMLELLGYSRLEMSSAGVEVFFDGKEAYRRFIADVVPVLSYSAVEQMECTLKKKDGTLIPCMVSGKAINKKDLAKGTVWVVEDMQKRLETERELENALERANSANIAKSTFLANMSHEIRTPLNGIIGLSELLLQHNLPAPQQEHLKLIHNAGLRLLSLIKDVLDYSKLEAGRFELEPRVFSLKGVMLDVMKPFQVIAEERGLMLSYSMEKGVPENLKTDQTKLVQVITNLVDNALKFTRQGEIRLRVRMMPSTGSNKKELLFEVADTGIGIPMKYKDKVFRSFSQVDASLSREVGGSGLGLSISKQLVLILGGEIWFESEDGYGTHFFFTLPYCQPVDQGKQTEAVEYVAENRMQYPYVTGEHRILVAEDEHINTVLIKTLLEQAGYHVDMVKDGREAVRAWERRSYACIIMDIQMPEMDGYEAVRQIRKHEGPGARVPIIAMTAHALTGDRQKCLDAGMDDYIAKPIDGSAVLRLLKKITTVF